VIGLLAVLLVINQEIRVYKYVLTYGWAILGASFGPQIILALFWKRSTYAGCLAGMLTGFLWALIWQNVYDASKYGVEIYNLPFAFCLAFVVNVVVSLLTGNRGSGTGVRPS
jgi:Na+/proline symporter